MQSSEDFSVHLPDAQNRPNSTTDSPRMPIDESEDSFELDPMELEYAELRGLINRFGINSDEVARYREEHPDIWDLFQQRRLLFGNSRIHQRQLNAGDTIGDFQIVRAVSEGGMGIIYEAQQLSLDRRVALKTIQPQLVDDRFRMRFRRERRVLAKLHESHVIPVYAAGTETVEDQELHYFAMPFIPGSSLAQIVEQVSSSGGDVESFLKVASKQAELSQPETNASGAKSTQDEVNFTSGDSNRHAASTLSMEANKSTDAGNQDISQSGHQELRGNQQSNDDRQQAASPPLDVTAGIESSLGQSVASHSSNLKSHGVSSAGKRDAVAGDSHSDRRVRLKGRWYREVAQFVVEIARALHNVHTATIVHRDIKPSNIMIDSQGHGWLIDFGLASFGDEFGEPTKIDEAAKNTSTQQSDLTVNPVRSAKDEGSVAETPIESGFELARMSGHFGTRQYMAPEQFQIEESPVNSPEHRESTQGRWACAATGQAGPVTDVWGLGAVLYELLTLQHFELTTPLELGKNIEVNYRLPREIAKDVPRELESICLKALAPSVDTRYSSAEALADDLERWLTHRPAVAARYSPMRRAWLWARRNVVPASIMFILLIAAGITSFFMIVARKAEAVANEAKSNAISSERVAQIATADANVTAAKMAISAHLPNEVTRFDVARQLCDVAYKTYEELDLSPITALAAYAQIAQLSAPPILTIKTDDAAISAFSIAKNKDQQDYAILANIGGDVTVYDLTLGVEVASIGVDGRTVTSLVSIPGSSLVVVGGDSGFVSIWDYLTGQKVHIFPKLEQRVTAVAVSADGKTIAAATGNDAFVQGGMMMRMSPKPGVPGVETKAQLHVWDVATRTKKSTWVGHKGCVYGLKLSHNGEFVLSGSDDMSMRYWNANNGQLIHEFATTAGPIREVVLAPDDRMAAGITYGNSIVMASIEEGKAEESQRQFYNTSTGAMMDTTMRSDFQRILVSSRDGNARLYDILSDRVLLTFSGAGDGNRIGRVEFIDTDRIVTVSDGSISVWNAGPEPFTRAFQMQSNSVNWSLSGTGDLAASAGRDGLLRLWSTRTGRVIKVFPTAPKDSFQSVALSNDGSLLLAGGSSLELWHVATARSLGKLQGHQAPILSVSISQDGRFAVSGDQSGVAYHWNLATKKRLAEFTKSRPRGPNFQTLSQVQIGNRFVTLPPSREAPEPPRVESVVTSNSSQFVATQTNAIYLWDAKSGELVGMLPESDTVSFRGLCFSPDDSMLAAWASLDSAKQQILIWNTENPKTKPRQIKLVAPNGGRVAGMKFSRDQRLLLLVRPEGTFSVYDVLSGKDLHTSYMPIQINSATFSRNGQRILMNGIDGTARLLDLDAVEQYLMQAIRVEEAQQEIKSNPESAEAIATFADWYQLRGNLALSDKLLRQVRPTRPDEAQFQLFINSRRRGSFRAGDWNPAIGPGIRKPQDVGSVEWESLSHSGSAAIKRLLDVASAGGPHARLGTSADGNSMVIYGQQTNLAKVMLSKKNGVSRFETHTITNVMGGPCTVSSDGKTVLSLDATNKLNRVDIQTFLAKFTPQNTAKLPARVKALQMTSNGQRVILALANGTVLELTKTSVGTWKTSQEFPNPKWLMPDARNADPKLNQWLKRLASIQETLAVSCSAMAFDEKSNRVIVGYGIHDSTTYPSYVGFIDLNEGRVFGVKRVSLQGLNAVAIAKGGQEAAIGLEEGVAFRISVDPTGECVHTPLKGHRGAVHSLAFSEDNRMLLTGGTDHQIRVWISGTPQPIANLPHRGPVSAVTVTTSPKPQAISIAKDGCLYLWDLAGL